MAQRTTTDAVQAVLMQGGEDYNFRTSPSLQPAVDTATVIVDRVETCAISKSKALTDAELELIERWLAAHVYKQSHQAPASKTTGKASASFQGQTGLGIDGTKYGQMALRIDYSGCLNVIDKRQVAGSAWLGKPKSDQIPYEERD